MANIESATTADSTTTKKASAGRSIALVGAGQALESFDFLLFGSLSPQLGAQFFGGDAVSSTLNALAVYGVGFVFRPVGAVFFGWIADRVGRRPMMLLSVAVMALSALLMGLMPTASVIGVWAAVLLVLLRIVQGLAFGIEAPLNATYNVEIGKRERLGRYSGLIYGWVQLGLLTASLVAFFTSLAVGADAMKAWGWRIPFLIGGVLGIIVLIMRRGLPETLHEAHREEVGAGAAAAEVQRVQPAPELEGSQGIWRQIGRHWLALVATIFVVGGVQILNYALNVALPSLAQSQYKVDPAIAFATTSAFSLIIVILCPIFGRLADRWKVSRLFIVSRWILVPAAFLLLLYAGSIGAFVGIMLLGAVVLSPSLAIFTPIGASLMPTQGRTAGAGLAYSVGVAIFGGTASYIFVWMQVNGLTWLFCVYGAVVCIASIFLYQAAVKKTGLYAGQ